jgi:hypothetical protein
VDDAGLHDEIHRHSWRGPLTPPGSPDTISR